MRENKLNVFLLITSVLSISILVIGATYSFFTMSTMSKVNAVSVEAGKVQLGLGISPIYTGYKLVPMNDEDVMKAYHQKCLDNIGSGACLAYGIEVFNFADSQDIIGKIDFNLNGIANLSYLVLDENNNIYLNNTKVGENGTNMPLGDSFTLNNGSSTAPFSRKFVLILWISNLDRNQNEEDMGGVFSATVTYSSVLGGRITATVDGETGLSAQTALVGEDNHG